MIPTANTALKICISLIALMAMIFYLAKTKNVDVTYQQTLGSFDQYQDVVEDFLKHPSDEKLSAVSHHQGSFIYHYQTLIDHQTAFNKVFKIEPILTEQEIAFLKELKNQEQKLDEQLIDTTWKEVYIAADFSGLLEEAEENGEFQSETIQIKKTGRDLYQITIIGTFRTEDTTNILRRYFLIETEKGNFYWEKPSDYSIKLSDIEAELKIGRNKYSITGRIISNLDE
ncbi:hypothetical protein [Mesobacillus subterraneus]|uniref:Uncharacterized protein n=1 Tax=Mesobacillus subterraneus TaxID=285983 RepID=A0A427TX09_9BACI|nr:hypothetical protein [Mesobacillus subterraneus]RSD28991.1 hypothetical protein EJA10_02450 [Mesobacillus subterraneus]